MAGYPAFKRELGHPRNNLMMTPLRKCLFGSLAILAGSWHVGHLAADVITLRNGGEIAGEILKDEAPGAKTGGETSLLSIRTLSGSVIVVAKGEVESINRRRVVIEQYEARARTVADTVEAHWELAEWCREKGLKEQRESELLRIVELEPDHELARRGLGHVRHEGAWTTRDAIMASRGYIKHKGRYVLPQELELIKQDQADTEQEKAWYKRVNMWHGWLSDLRPERQAEALGQLRAISDPHAVTALYRAFNDDANEQLRLMYVEILANIDDEKSLGPLVTQSLKDASSQVRHASVLAIPKARREKTLPVYLKSLKHDANVIVNRAAEALGMVGDEQIVPQLIEALVTRHKYKMQVPDQNPGIGVATNGTMAPPAAAVPLPPDIAVMLATGQLPYGVNVTVSPGVPIRTKTATVYKNEQNASALQSLQQITGENFGYDKQAWKTWFSAKRNGTIKPRKKS